MADVTPEAAPVPAAPPTPSRGRAWVFEGVVWAVAAIVVGAALAVPALVGTEPTFRVSSVPATLPPDGPSLVGITPFDGPATAQEIHTACLPQTGFAAETCYTEYLEELLYGRGATVAFRELENLTFMDSEVAIDGHPLSHGLGRATLAAYGGPTRALQNCPYYLASGCFHGVLQSFFDNLGAFNPGILPLICPKGDAFREFQCLHGLGHGLELHTNYDLVASLELCDYLVGQWQQESCQTGAIMENLMGYLHSLRPTAAGGHDHGHVGPPPVFMLNATDPHYPCNALDPRFGKTCYIFQTSVTLQLNGWDFAAAGQMCATAPAEHVATCFGSLGRDASAAAAREPLVGYSYCSLTAIGLDDCIKGFVEEAINNAADPLVGFPICPRLPATVHAACYEGIGFMTVTLRSDELARAAVCDLAGEFENACRKGASLPARV